MTVPKNKIPAKKTCLKKILRAVIRKKKNLAEDKGEKVT